MENRAIRSFGSARRATSNSILARSLDAATICHCKGFPQRDVEHPVVDVAGDCALERRNTQPAEPHLKQRTPDDRPLLPLIIAGQQLRQFGNASERDWDCGDRAVQRNGQTVCVVRGGECVNTSTAIVPARAPATREKMAISRFL
jgi:hypothetical protein